MTLLTAAPSSKTVTANATPVEYAEDRTTSHAAAIPEKSGNVTRYPGRSGKAPNEERHSATGDSFLFLFLFVSFPRGSASRENGASTRSVARPTPCGARSLATARPAQQTFSASVSATALDEKTEQGLGGGRIKISRAPNSNSRRAGTVRKERARV
jgi:hypothetical protein